MTVAPGASRCSPGKQEAPGGDCCPLSFGILAELLGLTIILYLFLSRGRLPYWTFYSPFKSE